MLEREEPKPVNRPLVAGILWKRIDKGWQLGVDATRRYTLKDWNDRKAFLKNLRDESIQRQIAASTRDRYRESNARTAELTGIDLAAYGYRL